MRNVKFRCAFALSVVDANKNQTILSSIVFTMAQYTVPLGQEIRENTWILCKSKVVAIFVFCCIEEYVRVLFNYFLTPTLLCPSHRFCIF